MATPTWHISGQYYENCSCDFVCPCVDARASAEQREAITAIASGSAGRSHGRLINRCALAHAVKSQATALGLSWRDMSQKNHGQYAPFSWRGA